MPPYDQAVMEDAAKRNHPRIGHWSDVTAENLLDWLIVLVTGLLLGMVVYQLGGYLPFGRPMIPMVALTGILLVLHGLSWLARRDPAIHPYAWIVLPFLVYAGFRTWTLNPSPWLGELQFWTFTAAAVVWWTILHHYRHREQIWTLLVVAMITGAACFGVAIYQHWYDPLWLPMGRIQHSQYWIMGRVSGTFGVPNNFAGYLALLFPLFTLTAAAKRLRPATRVLLGLLAVAMLEGIVLSISRGAMLAMVPVLALVPVFVLRRPLYQVLGTLAFAGVVVAGSWWVITEVETVQRRIDEMVENRGEPTRRYKWQAAVEMFQDSPHLGHGLGSYEFMLDAYLPEGFTFAPRYTHNDYLNTLADLGWPGTLLLFGPAFALWLLTLRAWWSTPFLARSPSDGRLVTPMDKILLGWLGLGAVSFGLHLVVDFHLKLPGVLLLATIMFALAARRLTRRRWRVAEGMPVRVGFAVLCVICGSILAHRGTVVALGTHHFFIANERLDYYLEDPSSPRFDSAFLELTQRRFERALRHLPNHADARARLGVTLLYRARLDPARREAFADLALGHIDAARSATSHWRFEIFRALALAQLQRPPNEILATVEAAVAAAPNHPDAWYYLAIVLSQFPDRIDEAARALERVLVLDPKHDNGLALAARLTAPDA